MMVICCLMHRSRLIMNAARPVRRSLVDILLRLLIIPSGLRIMVPRRAWVAAWLQVLRLFTLRVPLSLTCLSTVRPLRGLRISSERVPSTLTLILISKAACELLNIVVKNMVLTRLFSVRLTVLLKLSRFRKILFVLRATNLQLAKKLLRCRSWWLLVVKILVRTILLIWLLNATLRLGNLENLMTLIWILSVLLRKLRALKVRPDRLAHTFVLLLRAVYLLLIFCCRRNVLTVLLLLFLNIICVKCRGRLRRILPVRLIR